MFIHYIIGAIGIALVCVGLNLSLLVNFGFLFIWMSIYNILDNLYNK